MFSKERERKRGSNREKVQYDVLSKMLARKETEEQVFNTKIKTKNHSLIFNYLKTDGRSTYCGISLKCKHKMEQ